MSFAINEADFYRSPVSFTASDEGYVLNWAGGCSKTGEWSHILAIEYCPEELGFFLPFVTSSYVI